ncbi:MAG: hypothetical protein CMO54_03245 [Verrucomicrobiales bacterium]|nr:hypothetical protein [Verrucomicrobiales bacterium]
MNNLIKSAFLKRQEHIPIGTDSYRLFDGVSDGMDGVYIDNFAGHYLVSYINDKPRVPINLNLQEKSIWIKKLNKDQKLPPTCLKGDPKSPNVEITENHARFEIDFSAGYSQGIFLDQRDNRLKVIERASNIRVLNCFSYTCCFSVVAALGGAESTTSIDLSKSYLEWGKKNFILNNIKERDENHFFCKGDVFEWLKQFNRKGRKFGLVIVDPPSFSRSGKSGSFSVINDYSSLIESSANLVEPFGWILACSNHRKLTNNKFISSIKEGVKNAKRKIIDIELSQMPFDFSGEKYLKSVWLKLA